MKSGLTLIDKASEMCGSDAELARRLGTKPPAISEMRAGKRTISPETAALLADIAHEDAREAVIQAVIERNKTGPKAEQIREILGKALAAGVAAVLVFSYADLPISAMESAASELTILHIVLSGLATAAFLVIGCATVRVPQARLSVKGKGFAAVLTRSLRFATGCGFRAAP